MTNGLRDRKKKERNERIFAAATDLFQEKGYADTTITDIAKRADVGVGTIYNYFSSKHDILLSIVANRCLEKRPEEKIYKNDPVKTLCNYLHKYFKEWDIFDKDIWRSFFAALFTGERELIERAFELDMKIVGELSELCRKMQDLDMIASDLDPNEVGMAVYLTYYPWLTNYILIPEMDLETAVKSMEQHVRLLYRGFAPKTDKKSK